MPVWLDAQYIREIATCLLLWNAACLFPLVWKGRLIRGAGEGRKATVGKSIQVAVLVLILHLAVCGIWVPFAESPDVIWFLFVLWVPAAGVALGLTMERSLWRGLSEAAYMFLFMLAASVAGFFCSLIVVLLLVAVGIIGNGPHG